MIDCDARFPLLVFAKRHKLYVKDPVDVLGLRGDGRARRGRSPDDRVIYLRTPIVLAELLVVYRTSQVDTHVVVHVACVGQGE